MNKRGQLLTGFLIIGIVIVVAFGFVLYLNSQQAGKDFEPEVIERVELDTDTEAFRVYAQDCLEQVTREGLNYFGVKESSAPLMEDYIQTEFPVCIDFEAFKALSMEFYLEPVESSVVITENAILVEVDFPIKITKSGIIAQLRDFNYYLKREKSIKLDYGEDGTTIQEHIIITEDEDAELVIKEGTKVTDINGQPLDEVSLKVLDVNFDGLSNGVVVGKVVYEGIPEGARFDPPIEIIVKYNEFEIRHQGYFEEELSIAYWDKNSGIWKSVPSYVDTKNNRIIGQLSHFTKVAIVADCTNPQYAEKLGVVNWRVFGPETVFVQTCGESYEQCMEANWVLAKDIYEWPHPVIEHSVFEAPSACELPIIQSGNEFVNEQRFQQIPNWPCVGPFDWDQDDYYADCPLICRNDCRNEVCSIPSEYVKNDGIADGGCTCRKDIVDPVNFPGVYEDTPECDRAPGATPESYGYFESYGPGGIGVMYFYIEGNGNSCVASENGELKYLVSVDCFEDECNNTEGGINGVFNPVMYTPLPVAEEHGDDPDWVRTVRDLNEDYWVEYEITQGWNSFAVKIDNTNKDGCARADVTLAIVGTGVRYVSSGPVPIPWDIPEEDPCISAGESCMDSIDCCSGNCDLAVCASGCLDSGEQCYTNWQCCSGSCEELASGNFCSGCKGDSNFCSKDDDCCSGSCVNNICGGCKDVGWQCYDDDDCCSTSCFPNGLCGGCKAKGDLCWEHGECCSWNCGEEGLCRPCVSDGSTAQREYQCCSEMLGDNGQCVGCRTDGSPCENSGECCSNQCINYICGEEGVERNCNSNDECGQGNWCYLNECKSSASYIYARQCGGYSITELAIFECKTGIQDSFSLGKLCGDLPGVNADILKSMNYETEFLDCAVLGSDPADDIVCDFRITCSIGSQGG